MVDLTFSNGPCVPTPDQKRVGVFSDVHAHLDHLEAVLDSMNDRGVQAIWCLGDFVDGGPDHLAVTELVLDLASNPNNRVIQGNHEDCLVRARWPGWGSAQVAEARTAGAVIGNARDRIAGLPIEAELENLGIYLVHATVRPSRWLKLSGHMFAKQYTGNLLWALRHAPQPIVIVGHSHRPAYATLTRVGAHLQTDFVNGEPVKLETPCVLNPGGWLEDDPDTAPWLELEFDQGQVIARWWSIAAPASAGNADRTQQGSPAIVKV